MVLALLAERMGARFKAHRTRNDIAEGRLSGQPVTLARPHSYMNLSGGPVAALLGFYKLSPERVVVIHDELDVPFGGVRLKLGGGDNGHNGLRSITASLGTRDYYRVRFGIGRPPGRMDAADLRAQGLLRGRAQGTPLRPRPLRRRRGDLDHQGPDRSPEPSTTPIRVTGRGRLRPAASLVPESFGSGGEQLDAQPTTTPSRTTWPSERAACCSTCAPRRRPRRPAKTPATGRPTSS